MMNVNRNYHNENQNQNHQRYYRNNYDDDNSNNNNGRWQQHKWQSWLTIFLLLYTLSIQFGVFDQKKPFVDSNNENGIGSQQIIRNDGNNRLMMRNSDTNNNHNRDHHYHRHHDYDSSLSLPPYHHQRQQQQHQPAYYDHLNLNSLVEDEKRRMETMMKRMEKEGQLSHHFHHHQRPGHHYDMQKKQQQQQLKEQQRKRKIEEERNNNSEEKEEEAGTSKYSALDAKLDVGSNGDDDDDANNNLSTTTGNMADAGGRLRAALLTDYDKNSFPWEWAWIQSNNNNNADAPTTGSTENTIDTDNANNLRGLPVEFGLNFHKVFELNIADSTADIIVWVRMRWHDPRLVWDPKDYNGLNVTWFFLSDGTSGGEVSEIFAPDIYLWNQAESMQSSFANTYAMVTNDGTVYWSRPGRLKSTCKYEGLQHFPYDELSCKFEFGSWSHSGLYLRPTKFDGIGFSVGGPQTAGASFEEFKLVGGNVEEYVYPSSPTFPYGPDEDWPVLIYTGIFSRASEPYVRSIILVNIILNLGAFVCFWMSPATGERMGLAITSVLAAVASELVVSQMFPICDEISWYNKFALGSLAFAMFVVFENGAVMYFYFYTGTDLTPSYVKWIQNKRRNKRNKEAAARNDINDENNKNKITDAQSSSSQRQEQYSTDSTDRFSEESREVKRLEESLGSFKNRPTTNLPATSAGGGMKKQISFEPNVVRTAAAEQNSSTTVDNDRRDSFSTTGVNSPRMNSNRQIGDNSISSQRWWFQSLKSRKDEEQMNEYWQMVAGYIDEAARVTIPVLYFIFLAIVFDLNTSKLDN